MPPLEVVEAFVASAMEASREGALERWLQRHRHAGRWLLQGWLQPVLAAGGDQMRDAAGLAAALGVLLRWAIAGLRPDRQAGFDGIDRAAWLDRTSWRPMLSVACQYGFVAGPDFRDRYHARSDEPPASRLCGLWSIGPSTYYRYLDKGKRALATVLRELPPRPEQRLTLRDATRQWVAPRLGADAPAWHRRQAVDSLAHDDSLSALWHLRQAGDLMGFVRTLQAHSVELANEAETEPLVAQWETGSLHDRARFDLLIARAGLARMRGESERELELDEQALRIATGAAEPLLLGIVYGVLGKYFEQRDADRAFAYYQESAESLRESGVADDPVADAEIVEQYVATLVRLAWLFVLRDDPRARPLLDRADAAQARRELSPAVLGLLEQTWGEFHRRAGDLDRAIEHRHRALLLFERLDDQQAVLKTASNLGLLYGEKRDHPRAIEYAQRVIRLAASMSIEPEILSSTHINLGVAHFWQGDYDQARDEYQRALDIAMRASLHRLAGRAHYNLAEVAYLRFKASGDAADEARGDAHAAAALQIWPHDSDPAHHDATRKLKADILGPGEQRARDRFLPQELAAHPQEMAEIQRQRERLAVPMPPEQQARAHLAIANAYLAISTREREAARALVERHGLHDTFAAEFDALRRTFERELTREQKLAAQWQQQAADLLGAPRCTTVLRELIEAGSLNKSRYAELCEVSPATASKHLVTLAERGLLEQTGRGPSTRYVLPA